MMQTAVKRLLIVEDDDDTQELLFRLFSRLSYAVTVVATAEEGLAKLREQPFDLVISDNQLRGGKTGSWMIAEAAADGVLERTAILMYTADDTAAPSEGVVLLSKPAPLDELRLTAERAVNRARGRRAFQSRNDASPDSQRA
jgi:DNA-binding NtrC family response regulator